MAISLIDVAKHEKKLRRLIELNNSGATVLTERTSQAIVFGSSKSEFIEAFKYDVDKTAKYLFDSLGIINSVSNGIVTEISTLDNSVEDFFGSSYNDGIITLCGVSFDVNRNMSLDKSTIVEVLYGSQFNITKKELSVLAKTLVRYETAVTDIERAVLYPSTVLADKLIEKIGVIDNCFNDYINTLSYEDKIDFSTEFNRSGVTDVIQNSTYIDIQGIRQTIPAHKSHSITLATIADGIKNNDFKYIEAVEIDGDGDVNKALKVIRQIEKLKINCESKFTFKFRKLGNLKATGVFYPGSLIVAEDVRNTSALIHEIAHFIHLTNDEIFNSEFVNKMIDKMKARIDFNNLSVNPASQQKIMKKIKYYESPKEVLARTLEIAALLASEKGRVSFGSDDFDMIKSRPFYEKREGIYFNFKSFDEETIDEMLALWELFYETSFGCTQNTNINNFRKIDTNFRKIVLENVKSVKEILVEEAQKQEKEKRELYSLINGDNIQIIIDNCPSTLDLRKLATVIFTNLHYCGSHKKSCDLNEWTIIKEFKSKVVMTLLRTLEKEITHKEYIDYLVDLEKERIINVLETGAGVSGFSSVKFRIEIRKNLLKTYPDGFYTQFSDYHSLIRGTVLAIADSSIVNDFEFIKGYLEKNKFLANTISNLTQTTNDTVMKMGYYFLEKEANNSCLIPTKCFNDIDFTVEYFKKDPQIMNLCRISDEMRNNADAMNKILPLFREEKLIDAFTYTSKELQSNPEFMKEWISKEPMLEKFLGKELKSSLKKAKKEVKKIETKKEVTPKEKIEVEVAFENIESFEDIIKKAAIEDFVHTQTGETLKVLKIEEKIEDFKGFNHYLISNKIGYYSRYAKGFVINNMDKVASATASVSIYSSDLLANFANGTLF